MYNLPESDFFKYLSLVNSIPSIWKTRTRNENINIPETPKLFSQILNQTQINRYIYNYLKNKELEKSKTIRNEMESDVSGYNFKLEIDLHLYPDSDKRYTK